MTPEEEAKLREIGIAVGWRDSAEARDRIFVVCIALMESAISLLLNRSIEGRKVTQDPRNGS